MMEEDPPSSSTNKNWSSSILPLLPPLDGGGRQRAPPIASHGEGAPPPPPPPPSMQQEEQPFQWSPPLAFALKGLALGPSFSQVSGGEELSDSISDMREQIGLPHLNRRASQGLSLFFDDLTTRADAREFFETVLPSMADLVLRLPQLLSSHLNQTGGFWTGRSSQNGSQSVRVANVSFELRVLHPQQAGLVLLSQEFVAALLACAFFCLYPAKSREELQLPHINLDYIFGAIQERQNMQEEKMKCMVHYFTRVCKTMPQGMISFERKVLPLHRGNLPSFPISEPDKVFWEDSKASLCPFTVFENGTIEDQGSDALEVDFANKYLGGGVLFHGCVQEEIRFIISPELIAGMLFLPPMAKNEAIEIIGAERFCCYGGYGASFCFVGDYIDTKSRDSWGRLETRIVAIDALMFPGERQFSNGEMLREVNKAFCGFLDHAEIRGYVQALDLICQRGQCFDQAENLNQAFEENLHEESSLEVQGASGTMNFPYQSGSEGCADKQDSTIKSTSNLEREIRDNTDRCYGPQIDIEESCTQFNNEGPFVCTDMTNNKNHECRVGIATGNWGCGAFGGDVELKSLLQWIAASQARRPFVHYFAFGDYRAQKLQQLTEWILKEGWNVSELWNLLLDYGHKRMYSSVKEGLFDWILPPGR